MEDLELISLLNECNKMSVFEVSNYLLGKLLQLTFLLLIAINSEISMSIGMY